jgi:hypothetical protein
MNGSERPWNKAGGSVTAGALGGVVTGFLTMLLPLYVLPDFEQAGLLSIGVTTLVLLWCVVAALDSPEQRRMLLGFFWGVLAGAALLVALIIHALSQIGS